MGRPTIEIDVDEYNRLTEEGYTHKEKAEKLFVSTATLSRWKKKEGITDFRSVDDYIALRKQGYRDKHIIAKWNITFSALYQWKVKHNVPAEYFGLNGRPGNNGNGWQRWRNR